MKKLPDLVIDLLKEDDLWNELFTIIHDYTDANVTKFIDQLANVRGINSDTDKDIINDSIRQLGIDVHRDILEANGDNIRSGFYQMSQFYQINGSYHYPKFIEFILGSGLRVHTLYTNDYVDFYTQPQGTSIIDGGDWFPTSHVDISVYDGESETLFDLNIGEGDISYIKKANAYSEMSTLDKFLFDEALDAHIGRTLDMTVDDARFTRSVFRKRISDLFYKFAPIQEVIRNIYMARFASADLYISGSAIIRGRKYVADAASIVNIELLISDSISANEELGALKGLATWSNGGQTMVDMGTISDSAGLVSDSQNMMFKDPDVGLTKVTVVTAKFLDIEASKQVTVYMSGIEIVPDYINIKVNTELAGNTNAKILVQGIFGETSKLVEDEANFEWFHDSDNITIEGGYIRVSEVLFEEFVNIQLRYTTSNGTILQAQTSLTLFPALVGTVAARITQNIYHMDGDDLNLTQTVIQGQKYKIRSNVLFSDGTESEVDVALESMTEFIDIAEDNTFVAAEALSSYPFSLRSTLTEDERVTSAVEMYTAEAVEVNLLNIEISGDPTMAESSSQILRARGTWSNGVSSFLGSVEWSSSFGTDSEGKLNQISITPEGIITSPVVDVDTRYLIKAQAQRASDLAIIEGTFVVTVLETKRTLLSVDIYCADSLKEGITAPIQFFGRWNNGTRTQIMPDVINITERDTGILFCAASIENNQVVFANIRQLVLQNGTATFKESETGVSHNTLELEHVSGPDGVNGVFNIEIEYTFGSDTITSSRLLVATPKVKSIIGITHNIPEQLEESSRYFYTVQATYDNGITTGVLANWSVYDENSSSHIDDVPLDIISKSFKLEDIVYALTGYDREAVMELALTTEDLSEEEIKTLVVGESFFTALDNKPSTVQTWFQKLGILYATYDGKLFNRSVIQTRTVDEDEPFTLDCRVGSFEYRTTHTLTNKLPEPTNLILSWYIKGPVELLADEDITYSYSLVVNYDDLGDEYAVSNDWEIELYSGDDRDERREIIRYLVEVQGNVELLPMGRDGSGIRKTVDELDQEEMLDILPTRNVIDIDQNGYVYPKMNIAVHAIIKAIYNDNLSTFEETLDVYTTPVNKNLLGLDMVLVSPTENKTYDFGNLIKDEPNEWAEAYENTFRYQLAVELRKVGEALPITPEGVVVWRAEPVGRGISFDQASGRLYIAPQTEDSDVTLIASYSEEFRESETSSKASREEVESRYIIRVYATKAMDAILPFGPTFTLDNTTFNPTVKVRRRDNTFADLAKVLKWEIVSGDPSITQTSDYEFNIPSMTVDTTLTLRAIATEGLQVLTEEFTYNVLAGFIPTDLLLEYNPLGHKDNSVIQLRALLQLRNNPIPVDVTSDCYWLMGTEDEDISVGNRTGLLDVGYTGNDYTAVIRCVYTKDSFRQEKVVNIDIQSSYPIYWTDKQLPINTAYFSSILDAGEYEVLPSVSGGRILTITDSDEYTYFACPAELGTPKFSLVPSKVAVSTWGDMGTPYSVIRTYINDDVQDWNVYRSSIRGFGHIELSVLYSR